MRWGLLPMFLNDGKHLLDWSLSQLLSVLFFFLDWSVVYISLIQFDLVFYLRMLVCFLRSSSFISSFDYTCNSKLQSQFHHVVSAIILISDNLISIWINFQWFIIGQYIAFSSYIFYWPSLILSIRIFNHVLIYQPLLSI